MTSLLGVLSGLKFVHIKLSISGNKWPLPLLTAPAIWCQAEVATASYI